MMQNPLTNSIAEDLAKQIGAALAANDMTSYNSLMGDYGLLVQGMTYANIMDLNDRISWFAAGRN